MHLLPGSLRYGVPLLILVFTAALATYTAQRDRNAAEAVVRGNAVSQLLRYTQSLRRQVEQSFRKDAGQSLREDGLFADESGARFGVLLDDQQLVFAAPRPSWLGHGFDEISGKFAALAAGEPVRAVIERVRAQQNAVVHLTNGGRFALGVQAVSLAEPSAAQSGTRIGVLLVRKDLAHDLAQARRLVEEHATEMVYMLLALALVLGFLAHILVTRRLGVLVAAATKFAAGDSGARAGLHGSDEVATLGQAFDTMAAQVADQRRLLEQRVYARTQELLGLIAELRSEVEERRRVELALVDQKERVQVTLASIGDGVITTDLGCRVDYLNPVAEKFTGWSTAQAAGLDLSRVFRVLNEQEREPVDDPVLQTLQLSKAVDLAESTLLVCGDGLERPIAGSAAPITDHNGKAIGAVLVFRDISAAHDAARQLSYNASHDALTGLINRREFERRVECVLGLRQADEVHAILYIDLDQFKVVNDTCGHAAGDELLRQIGAVLTPLIRHRDTFARLGGDEFGVLLEYCQLDQARRIAEQLREALHEFRFAWQDRSWTVGASIGLVPFDAEIDTLASVLKAADIACYVAKERGRNRVHIYERHDRDLAQRHGEMQWVPRIQEALAKQRFTLYYQPIVPLSRIDQPHGELLLRLLNPDGSIVPPTAFIPAAERYNQMQAIDRWVIQTVFRAICDPAIIPSQVTVMINLSGQSLSDRRFLDFVEQECLQSPVPLNRICFEITETAAITNLSYAMRFFSALKPHGVKFALDDFGCGLSSFAYLKTLPVDYLKIDGAFVKDMVHDSVNFTMVEAIHKIGHVMGIETIAECVENDDILWPLREIGVDYVQGNALSRPVPLADIPLNCSVRQSSESRYLGLVGTLGKAGDSKLIRPPKP
jgi:diguanylate cyclase (GGDEF)-like protein/PAS domain S-box-containing protein